MKETEMKMEWYEERIKSEIQKKKKKEREKKNKSQSKKNV